MSDELIIARKHHNKWVSISFFSLAVIWEDIKTAASSGDSARWLGSSWASLRANKMGFVEGRATTSIS